MDTYDTISSGIPNFLTVAYALHKLGYQAKGIRLDSGDLAHLSRHAKSEFAKAAAKLQIPYFEKFVVVASNDLDVNTIASLNTQNHKIDIFGVGTNLVTCADQPALGCVFKLVEVGFAISMVSIMMMTMITILVDVVVAAASTESC